MAVLAAMLMCRAHLDAQNLTININENGVWCHNKAMTPDQVGMEVEKYAPECVFIYVNYDTPVGLLQDIQGAVSMNSTAEIVVLNPDRYADKGRNYGPVMVRHELFLEWGLLEQSRKEGRCITFSAQANHADRLLPERVDTVIRTRDAAGKLRNKYDTVCIELEAGTSIGAVYGSCYAINENSHGAQGEDIPPVNILFKVPESDYSREAYIRIVETDPDKFAFETVNAGKTTVWPVYRKEDVMDPSDFAESLVAFKSISEVALPGARPGKGRAVVSMTITPLGTLTDVKIVRPSGLPGLDEAIVQAVSAAPAYWVPQFRKDNPVNINITLPVTGEIGAY